MPQRAEDWRWSSASLHRDGRPNLDVGPVRRPDDWLAFVNEPQTEAEVKRLRQCLQRGRPFGESSWQLQTAQRLGLESSLRPRGRPKKIIDEPKGADGNLFD